MIWWLLEKVVLGLSIAAPIGPINIEIIRRGIYQGLWPSLLVGAGGMTSDLLLMFFMYQGLSKLLTFEWVSFILFVFGAIILTYTGMKSFLVYQGESEIEQLDMMRGSGTKKRLIRSYLTGFMIAAFNPVNLFFWLGIYGSVLSESLQHGQVFSSFLMSSAVFIGIGLWNVHLALTIHIGKKWLGTKTLTMISAGASLLLIGFGMYFGYRATVTVIDFLLSHF